MISENQKFGLDKIEHTSKLSTSELKPLRDQITIPENIGKLELLDPEQNNNDVKAKDLPKNHKSLIRLTGNIPLLIDYLLTQDAFRSMPLFLYLVEVYRDTSFPTIEAAIEHLKHLIQTTVLLHHKQDPFLYWRDHIEYITRKSMSDFKTETDFIDYVAEKRKKRKSDSIHDQTLYLGGGDFRLKIYGRLDKFDGTHCTREELTFMGYHLRNTLKLKKGKCNFLDALKNMHNFEILFNRYVKSININGLDIVRHMAKKQNKHFSTEATLMSYYHGIKRLYGIYTNAFWLPYCENSNINYRQFQTLP